MTDQPTYTILIASYLEPEYVARIQAVSPRLHVIYAPDLLAPPRYHADHYNVIARTPEQEARWRALLLFATKVAPAVPALTLGRTVGADDSPAEGLRLLTAHFRTTLMRVTGTVDRGRPLNH